ncbi:hypothetical protein ALC56_03221, partial [Trachymyrmex septentrionalis]
RKREKAERKRVRPCRGTIKNRGGKETQDSRLHIREIVRVLRFRCYFGQVQYDDLIIFYSGKTTNTPIYGVSSGPTWLPLAATVLSNDPSLFTRLLDLHPRRSNISMYEFDGELRVSLNKEVYARAPAWSRTTRLRGVEFHQSRAARDGREIVLRYFVNRICAELSLGLTKNEKTGTRSHHNDTDGR